MQPADVGIWAESIYLSIYLIKILFDRLISISKSKEENCKIVTLAWLTFILQFYFCSLVDGALRILLESQKMSKCVYSEVRPIWFATASSQAVALPEGGSTVSVARPSVHHVSSLTLSPSEPFQVATPTILGVPSSGYAMAPRKPNGPILFSQTAYGYWHILSLSWQCHTNGKPTPMQRGPNAESVQARQHWPRCSQ